MSVTFARRGKGPTREGTAGRASEAEDAVRVLQSQMDEALELMRGMQQKIETLEGRVRELEARPGEGANATWSLSRQEHSLSSPQLSTGPGRRPSVEAQPRL